MPWVNKEDCTGCGLCVEICPVDTITLVEGIAEIDMDGCIRCGKCHKSCPNDAVRHDSEKIPGEIEANLEKVRWYLSHYETGEEKKACLKKSIRHFNLVKSIADKTIEQLNSLVID